MDKKVYWRRAVKYMVRLLVLVFALIAVMVATGMARTGADGNLADVFMAPKALLLFAIIVLWSLVYPKLGFIRQPLKMDFNAGKEQIQKVFSDNGFVLVEQKDNEMIFRMSSPLRRTLALWEDRIVVSATDGGIEMEGMRKEVGNSSHLPAFTYSSCGSL